MTTGRLVARGVALLILVVTGLLGLYSGVVERVDARTPFQASVTAGVLLYGVLGLVSVYGVVRRRRWVVRSVTAWAVLIAYVSGTAALAYAGADATVAGAVGAALGAALIGAFVLWAVRPIPSLDSAQPRVH